MSIAEHCARNDDSRAVARRAHKAALLLLSTTVVEARVESAFSIFSVEQVVFYYRVFVDVIR